MRFRPLLILLVCLVLPSLARVHQMLKKGILNSLGLTKEPELARPSLPVPDHVWSLYDDVMEDRLQYDWIRHYYPKGLLEENSGLLLSFNLSLLAARNEEVRTAELRLRLRSSQPGLIKVYSGRNLSELVGSGTVSPTQPWTILDVTLGLGSHQPDSLELRINLPRDARLYVPPAHSVSAVPFSKAQSVSLMVYSEILEPSHVRRKRSAANKRRGKGRNKHHHHNHKVADVDKNHCRMTELYVDFEELHWQDWILQPKGYDAKQCTGTCPSPMPAHLNATNHAIIQALLHSLNPQIPPPCCVPVETSSLPILYMDIENRINIKNYADMRVEACGCH